MQVAPELEQHLKAPTPGHWQTTKSFFEQKNNCVYKTGKLENGPKLDVSLTFHKITQV